MRTFGWSFAITAAGLALAGVLWGWQGLAIVGILSILEISLSFDNAVINAGILRKMNAFWQKIFLTVGILIAVFGMRLVFPVVIVAITAKMGPLEAVNLAINDKPQYEHLVTGAHPAIAAFGGMFLLMIFLDFIFEEREHKWLGWLERPLAKMGKLDMLSVIIALIVLLVTAMTVATDVAHGGGDKSATVLLSGVAGLITYLVVGGISGYFEDKLEEAEDDEDDDAPAAKTAGDAGSNGASKSSVSGVGLAGKAAFFMFLYLEVIDASFSFDGVIGAFAVTNDIFEMALGLGIGAMYIRSLTVFLVRKGTLDDYVYLEHGAHYAIGALAVILLASIKYEIPEVVTGLVGVGLILLSFWSSVRKNRLEGKPGEGSRAEPEVTSGV
ncbi:membrane protein [Streptomyces rimosus subsp. rimosus]|nr:membrane protein [Streptomyces rimosus subsp. rimosus]KOT33068.1 membrane protein [Streptomyces sp. NRRL WC-3701]KOT54257.1 membrane protein [Streptomyces rimosus subsp. rimosus]KOT55659.1 membrane protein [Streptomyces rimosus subsp. rimosus]KOT70589.1 membrane protein [Streptomyces rimosus subsp. rimosus]